MSKDARLSLKDAILVIEDTVVITIEKRAERKSLHRDNVLFTRDLEPVKHVMKSQA